MSSDTYEAKQKFLAHLGISAPHVQMAIDIDPMARMIFDRAVDYLASLEEKPPVITPVAQITPDLAEKVYRDGFRDGYDWSQGPYGKGLPNVDAYWRRYLDMDGKTEPAKPLRDMLKRPGHKPGCVLEVCAGCGTDFWNADSPATMEKLTGTPRSMMDVPADTLEQYFKDGMKGRDTPGGVNPYPTKSLGYYMFVKGWVFRDIQLLACRFCESYGQEQIGANNVTQEQLDREAKNGRQK